MADLLTLLRDEATSLLEQELPTINEVRPLVGALVARLGRLEQEVIGKLEPAPVREPVTQPSAANTVQPTPSPAGDPLVAVQEAEAKQAEAEKVAADRETELAAAQAELAAAQKHVAELEASNGPSDTASSTSSGNSFGVTPATPVTGTAGDSQAPVTGA